MPPIIQANELKGLLGSEELVIIDASSGMDAKQNYIKKHLKGAIHVDLNSDLSHIKDNAADGGRHPLPNLDDFTNTLKNLGISEGSHVVIYDDKNGSNAAARFWWMLRAIGHKKVQVLNGGLLQAEKIGLEIEAGFVQSKQVDNYRAHHWILPTADIDEVERFSQNEAHLVVDVRASGRFRGDFEPIDLVAGHIPGAINLPFSANLNQDGLFLSGLELKRKYERLLDHVDPKNVIVHCGSGVTACHTILAMDYAGLDIPKLYIGSWSEWSRNNKPVAKGVH